MIIEIPEPSDFLDAGIDFLNFAWETVMDLIILLNGLEENAREEVRINFESDFIINIHTTSGTFYYHINDSSKKISEQEIELMIEKEIVNINYTEIHAKFWKSSQRELATAITLIQQGTELLLKARISEISPFLLLAGAAKDWKKDCEQVDTPFAEFKTVDSQELIRIHDTVAKKRLSKPFKDNFIENRKIRNTIMHSFNKKIELIPKNLISTILEISHELIGEFKWIEIRKNFIDRRKASYPFLETLETYHYITIPNEKISHEIEAAINILEPNLTIQFFNFNKKQRRYICLSCREGMSRMAEKAGEDGYTHLAHLRPNESNSTNLYCVICGNTRKVVREDCKDSQCKGNVIDSEENICLTCGEEQDI